MIDTRQVRERVRQLRAELAERRTESMDRAQRFAVATLEEELYECTQRLRELMPKHRISYRTTHAGWNMEHRQYVDWAQREDEEESPDEDGQRKRRIVRAAKWQPSQKQRAYLAALERGMNQVEVAKAFGVDKSTISRTVRRAQGTLTGWARQALSLQELAGEPEADGTVALDLSLPEVMSQVTRLLTVRQQMYLYLYYGEWQSLGEISSLLNVDRATVLRTIRRGLERLDACFCGTPVRLEGLETLEGLLMAGYSYVTPEDLAPRKAPGHGQYPKRAREPLHMDPEQEALEEEIILGMCGRGPDLDMQRTSGRFLDWLEEQVRGAGEVKQSALRQAKSRILRALFRLLKRSAALWKGLVKANPMSNI